MAAQDRIDFADIFEPDDEVEDPDYVPIPNGDLPSSGSEDEDSDTEPGEPISRARTRRFLENITSEELRQKCHRVLDVMKELGIDTAIFLDVISWGDEEAIADGRFRYERNALMTSVQLPSILRRWAEPPGENPGEGRIRKRVFRDFVLKLVSKWIQQEMRKIKKRMSPSKDPFSKENIANIDLRGLVAYLNSDEGAPTLAFILRRAGWSKRQAAQNTHKTPDNVSINYSIHEDYSCLNSVKPCMIKLLIPLL